jgi:hypothetical protein
VCESMDTMIICHESTRMYMEQNAKLKTFGLHTLGHHATRPLCCIPLGTMKWKIVGLRITQHQETRALGCVPLGIMKQKTIGLHTPRHQDVTKMNEKVELPDDDVWHVFWWFSWLDVAICVCVCVCVYIYIITTRMHRMIYVKF